LVRPRGVRNGWSWSDSTLPPSRHCFNNNLKLYKVQKCPTHQVYVCNSSKPIIIKYLKLFPIKTFKFFVENIKLKHLSLINNQIKNFKLFKTFLDRLVPTRMMPAGQGRREQHFVMLHQELNYKTLER